MNWIQKQADVVIIGAGAAGLRAAIEIGQSGGKALILEITPPASRISFHLLKFYLGRVVPLMARLGSGGRGAQELMTYYWDTIENCVPPPVIQTLPPDPPLALRVSCNSCPRRSKIMG